MATALKSLSDYNPEDIPDVSGTAFGLIVSEYNQDITFSLRDAAVETLLKHGADEKDLFVDYVPGAFELVSGAHFLNERHPKLEALICLGCVIKGDTDHDIYINHAVAQGVIQLSFHLKKPVIFGLLTPNTKQQALDRAGGVHGNKGVEAAIAAIKMLAFKKR